MAVAVIQLCDHVITITILTNYYSRVAIAADDARAGRGRRQRLVS